MINCRIRVPHVKRHLSDYSTAGEDSIAEYSITRGRATTNSSDQIPREKCKGKLSLPGTTCSYRRRQEQRCYAKERPFAGLQRDLLPTTCRQQMLPMGGSQAAAKQVLRDGLHRLSHPAVGELRPCLVALQRQVVEGGREL